MITIWDDHDLADNAWRDGAKHHDPAEHGPWAARVAAAARARQEWLPARLPRSSTIRSPRGGRWPIGDLAELLLLDTRLAGPRPAGRRRRVARPRRSGPLAARRRAAALAGRAAGRRQPAVGGDRQRRRGQRARAPAGRARCGGSTRSSRTATRSSTAGCSTTTSGTATPPSEPGSPSGSRARGERGGRTVILSGDVHSSWAFVGPVRRPAGEPVAVEMTTPGGVVGRHGSGPLPGHVAAARPGRQRPRPRVLGRGHRARLLHDRPHAATTATATWWFVHPYDDDPAARRGGRDGLPLRARRMAASAGAHGSRADRPRAGGPSGSPPAAAGRPPPARGDGDVLGSRLEASALVAAGARAGHRADRRHRRDATTDRTDTGRYGPSP